MNDEPAANGEGSDETLDVDSRDAGGTSSHALPPTQTHERPPPGGADVPQRIGHYSIKRTIASGGMGTVYEALQEKPRRTVALKLMRAGIASRSALRRFEYESQLLARLRHSGIAQVFDAGTHKDGEVSVPFFAMEYIPGAKPITDYADGRKLGTRERMKLFCDVCDAVHHGHQRGIIHRDLKPGNVLVDSQGQIKIIDFGVARATDSDLAITTLQTDVGQLIGTLQYMSPEQCEADPHDIDIRSDVYALGVVLYELLAGRLPYAVSRGNLIEATRVIREQPPTHLSTISRALHGDIDTIVLKALEKERSRRYQSAFALADDLRHYLNREPISARPPSMTYHLVVFARRHRGFIASVATIFLVLLGGVIVSSLMYIRSEEQRISAENARAEASLQRDQAVVARNESEAVIDFLQQMLAAVDPADRGRDVTVRELLDETSSTIGERLANQPLVEARLRYTLSTTYKALGDFEKARIHAVVAAETLGKEQGKDSANAANASLALANALLGQARFSEAERQCRQALVTLRRQRGDEHPDTLNAMNSLANALREQGRLREAEELHRQVLALQRMVLGDEDARTVGSMNNLGNVLRSQGRYREAESLFRHVIDVRIRVLGNDHPLTMRTTNNLALVLTDLSQFADAVQTYEGLISRQRRVLGDDHPETLRSTINLAIVLRRQGRHGEAAQFVGAALNAQRRVLGEEHPETLRTMNVHGAMLRDVGKYAEGANLHRHVLEIQQRTLGAAHPDALASMNNLANALRELSQRDEAVATYRRAIKLSRRAQGENHPDVIRLINNLAETLVNDGRPEEAAPLYEHLLEHYRQAAERPDAGAGDLNGYAWLLLNCEPPDSRDPEKALEMAQRVASMTDRSIPGALDTLALAMFRNGDLEGAIRTQREAISLLPGGDSQIRRRLEERLSEMLSLREHKNH